MAKKTYDFSAFDKKATPEKKGYDFSAFDESKNREPAVESSDDIGETVGDTLRGAAQGVTFGFADEIAGGAGAAGDLLAGRSTLEKIMESYRQNRDESRAEFDKAAERSPVANTIGNIGGGILSGLATAGAGTAAAGAGTIAKILNAAKVGAGAGAVAGVGGSEGDLTKGEVLDVGGDALAGAGMGALFGGGLQGGIEAAKGAKAIAKGVGNTIADSKIGQNLKKAYNYGKEGVDLVSDAGIEAAEKGIESAGVKLGSTAREINKEKGALLGGLRKKLEEAGLKVDISDDLEAVKSVIKQLADSPDELKRGDAKYLQGYLDDLLLGVEKEVQHTQYTPKMTKEVPAVPSAREKLQMEADRLAEQGRIEGQNPKFNIQESPDQRFLSLLKATDEQVGAAERAKPILDMEGNPTGQFSLDAGDAADSFKSGLKVKTVQNTPGAPAFTDEIPAQVGPVQTTKIRSGGGLKGTFDQADDVNSTLTNLSRVGENAKLRTPEALNTVGQTAKNIKNKMLNPEVAAGSVDETLAKEFADANTQTASSYKALEVLGIDASDFSVNPLTKEVELDNKAVLKMMDKVRQEAAEGSAGLKTRRTLDKALEFLEGADPAKAKALRPIIQRNSEIFDLANKGQNLGLLNKSTYTKAGTIQVGNRLGLGVKKLSDATPDQLKTIAQDLMRGGGAGMKLVEPLIQAMKKDGVGRNAALFAIQQNPEYRSIINQYIDSDEKAE
jgi:hypothetical protein